VKKALHHMEATAVQVDVDLFSRNFHPLFLLDSDLFSPEHTSSLKPSLNYQSPQRVAHFTTAMLTLLVGT